MNKIAFIIYSYAHEDGFEVYGSRIFNKKSYFDLKVCKKCIEVYKNGASEIFYKIETTKDCVNFCLIITSLRRVDNIIKLFDEN